MKHRDRFLPIFLLSLALATPVAFPGAANAAASAKDQGTVRQNDRNDDRYDRDDWDEWDGDWDDVDNRRFQGMDTNRDGRVTRREWRGNDRSFDNHDWNRDGVLSGTELRPGGRNDSDRWDDNTWNDIWSERFEFLDRNDNGYISTSEWTQDRRLFDRLDLNDDNRLSRSELLNLARQRQLSWDQRFTEMDVNRDGRLSQREWQRDRDAFERLDRNNDGYVTRAELANRDFDQNDDSRNGRWTESYPRSEERFQHFDRNRDRLLSRGEWSGSRENFDRLDRDRNGYLSVQEFMGW